MTVTGSDHNRRVSFNGAACPPDHAQRTYKVKVMSTRGQTRRGWCLLEDAGDVLAWVIDRQNQAWREKRKADNGAQALWADQRIHGRFGSLSAQCAQAVILGWARAFSQTAERRRAGDLQASFPMAKHRYVPVIWRKGEFSLTPGAERRRPRARLTTGRGTPSLELRLSHDHPYDPSLVRAVRLVPEGHDLFLAITAWVPIVPAAVAPTACAGADPGIIHPWAVTAGPKALLVSGRGMRAEERLHLEDCEGRDRARSRHRKPVRPGHGRPGQTGSRRWRKIRARQRKADRRNRRFMSQANYRAANLIRNFCVANGVGRVVYGDPAGIERNPSGRVHNRRMARWPRAQQRKALLMRLEEVGIAAEPVSERGTSSRCPACGGQATKSGRILRCASPSCGKAHHRDLAASQNITIAGEGTVAELTSVEHRRVGKPARRDRRRHRWVVARSAGTADARTRAAPPRTEPGGASSTTSNRGGVRLADSR